MALKQYCKYAKGLKGIEKNNDWEGWSFIKEQNGACGAKNTISKSKTCNKTLQTKVQKEKKKDE